MFSSYDCHNNIILESDFNYSVWGPSVKMQTLTSLQELEFGGLSLSLELPALPCSYMSKGAAANTHHSAQNKWQQQLSQAQPVREELRWRWVAKRHEDDTGREDRLKQLKQDICQRGAWREISLSILCFGSADISIAEFDSSACLT